MAEPSSSGLEAVWSDEEFLVSRIADGSASAVLSLKPALDQPSLFTIARYPQTLPEIRTAFVSVNCAALAPTLISSELFGHRKGTFTGAAQRRLGRFELDDGGIVFLDEVGDLPHDTQIAQLRVLQERQFERVGGVQPIRVDLRVVAATNRDSKAATADGSFARTSFIS